MGRSNGVSGSVSQGRMGIRVGTPLSRSRAVMWSNNASHAALGFTSAPLLATQLGLGGFGSMPRLSGGTWPGTTTGVAQRGRAAPTLRPTTTPQTHRSPQPVPPYATHMTALPPGFSCSTPLPRECTPPCSRP